MIEDDCSVSLRPLPSAASNTKRNSAVFSDTVTSESPYVDLDASFDSQTAKKGGSSGLQRAESTSKLHNAARKLRRSLSGKNLSNKYKNSEKKADPEPPEPVVVRPPSRSNSLVKVGLNFSASNYIGLGDPS